MGTGEGAGTPQRNTRQRVAVLDMLDSLNQFTSAQDIHGRLRDNGSTVGLTTVYRTLQSLAEARQVDVIRTDDGEAMYRRCTTEHHHHLVCRRCGRTIEVDSPTVESWAEEVAKRHGFADINHTIEIYGVCPDCAS
ncbi:MAG: transcriptional repressor [Actinomycetia bacterium]|nr:transcriptional repressor [Actinomycetes bacterium]